MEKLAPADARIIFRNAMKASPNLAKPSPAACTLDTSLHYSLANHYGTAVSLYRAIW
jgi:hypothetical protein